ncbi:MAG TPA: VanZ family protein [Labilithrix sp.]|nr:VanZ family protein [Labilithrix sp.]
MPDAETAPGKPRIGPTIWWLGLAASGLVAATLSLDAYVEGLPPVFEEIPHLDKTLHFALAGVLTFFLDGVLRRRMIRLGPVSVPLAAVLFLVPAAIEEFLQRFSVNRSSSVGDFAADAAGVAFFVWLSRRVGR